jgi:hypothetical protein
MKVWGSGDVDAIEARNIMQQRLCNMAASEAKIDAAALFGYSSDGKQVCGNFFIVLPYWHRGGIQSCCI